MIISHTICDCILIRCQTPQILSKPLNSLIPVTFNQREHSHRLMPRSFSRVMALRKTPLSSIHISIN